MTSPFAPVRSVLPIDRSLVLPPGTPLAGPPIGNVSFGPIQPGTPASTGTVVPIVISPTRVGTLPFGRIQQTIPLSGQVVPLQYGNIEAPRPEPVTQTTSMSGMGSPVRLNLNNITSQSSGTHALGQYNPIQSVGTPVKFGSIQPHGLSPAVVPGGLPPTNTNTRTNSIAFGAINPQNNGKSVGTPIKLTNLPVSPFRSPVNVPVQTTIPVKPFMEIAAPVEIPTNLVTPTKPFGNIQLPGSSERQTPQNQAIPTTPFSPINLFNPSVVPNTPTTPIEIGQLGIPANNSPVFGQINRGGLSPFVLPGAGKFQPASPIIPLPPISLVQSPVFLPAVAPSAPSHQELEQTYRPITVEQLTVVLSEAAKRETTFTPQLSSIQATQKTVPMTPEQAFVVSGLPVIAK